MTNLLKANFYKMKKNKFIWIASILSVIVAIYYIRDNYNVYHDFLSIVNINSLIFNYLPVFIIVSSILISTLLGFDYSNGSIKNKIIVGHSRLKIYISNLISTYLIILTIYLIYVLIICLSGIFLFKNLTFNFKFLINIIILFLIILSYTSISVFITMTINNDIVSPVLNVLNSFILIIISFILLSVLSEPKYLHSDDGIYINDVGIEVIDTENPMYIKGSKRTIYEIIVNILPTGEAFQKSRDRDINTNSYQMLGYSISFIIITNTLGIYLFYNKELN